VLFFLYGLPEELVLVFVIVDIFISLSFVVGDAVIVIVLFISAVAVIAVARTVLALADLAV
jgi:hypothetical protein